MTVYKVWCEWDMGWNVDDHIGVFRSEEVMVKKLESLDWDDVGLVSWVDAESASMLTIEMIQI